MRTLGQLKASLGSEVIPVRMIRSTSATRVIVLFSCSSRLLWKRRRRNWKRRDKEEEGNENKEEKLMSFAFTKIKDFWVTYVYIPYFNT